MILIVRFKGRNGLGNIYVWASGDGGLLDDCNCDGYAASMWTISINSATNNGHNAHYDESCSSTLASTFSSGSKQQGNGVVSLSLLFKKIFLISLFRQRLIFTANVQNRIQEHPRRHHKRLEFLH